MAFMALNFCVLSIFRYSSSATTGNLLTLEMAAKVSLLLLSVESFPFFTFVFFYFYKKSGNTLSVAIPPLIISTIIAVIVVYIVDRKIPYVPLIGAGLISIFGGLTLYFNNPIFIYLKPTIINLVFAAALLISDTFLKKNLLKLFLQVPICFNWRLNC